jgi:hypothetical protein
MITIIKGMKGWVMVTTVDPIVKPNKYPMSIGLMGPIGVLGEKTQA